MQCFDFNYYFPCQIAKVSKYDQYIKEFLLKNSELSVEKIGVFTISSSVSGEKNIQPQFISFQFNKKAQTSEELINYIAAETGKNKVLISSDLSSLFEDARQYANIGKAFSFAGLGDVALNRQGEFEFTPNTSNVPVADNSYAQKPDIEPAGKSQAGRNAVILVAFLIIALVVGGLGWGVYKYFNQKKAEPVAGQVPPADTTHTDSQPSASPAGNTQQAATANIGNDTTEYKFIFETTLSSARAYKRYEDLVRMQEKCFLDSSRRDSGMLYSIYVKIKALPKDTITLKDSVQKYFARPNPVIIK